MKQLTQKPKTDYDDLLVEIVNVIQSARRTAARSVNSVMTTTYWFVGHRIEWPMREATSSEISAPAEKIRKLPIAQTLSAQFSGISGVEILHRLPLFRSSYERLLPVKNTVARFLRTRRTAWQLNETQQFKDRKMNSSGRTRGTFWRSILQLIGHLGATALVFVALFSLGWIVSCSFNYLNSIHRFPDEILELVTRLEVGLVYIDAAVSGVVLTAGIVRFVLEVFRGN
jgi:hypothetical protein